MKTTKKWKQPNNLLDPHYFLFLVPNIAEQTNISKSTAAILLNFGVGLEYMYTKAWKFLPPSL